MPNESRKGTETMIDIQREKLVPLCDVPALLPKRNGKKINISTVFRWGQRGLQGRRLETVQVGGRKCTSLEAIQRFFDRLGQREEGRCSPTSKRRQRSIERAEKELEEMLS